MNNYLFFLSYARLDRDGDHYQCVRKFYDDLVMEVRGLKPLPKNNIGFFDGEDIEPGDEWPEKLGEALRTSQVFVCLFSPTYFTQVYCGKEWQVFRSRIDTYTTQSPSGTKRPPLILPVLLYPPEQLSPLPDAVSDIQYTYDDFPDGYKQEGLRMMMRQPTKYKDDYVKFLAQFAKKLIQVATSHPLPPCQTLSPIKDVKSAFHQSSSPSIGPVSRAENVGPRYVQFIFVAGQRDELQGVRRKTDAYGSEGGLDWKPYLPDFDKEISILAQNVATKENLRYEAVPLDTQIINRLEAAERDNKIVAIIVDTWTLRVQKYHNFMREYDERSFLNCVVLVPWNTKDDETANSLPVLEDVVRVTFLKKAGLKDPSCFLDQIRSPEELKRKLSVVLNRTRMRVIEKAEVIKKAESEQIITKPIIVGPGRTET